VLRLIIGRTSPRARDELDPLVAQIARGVSRMNDPNGVAANADRAKRIVAPLVSSLAAQTWDEAAVRSLMRTITDDPLVTTDVHSAEQAALSLQSLATVLTRRNPRLLRGAMSQSIDALFDEVKVRGDYDPARFAKKLDAVRSAIAN
jgi:predicted transcriptional regulator